MPPPDDSAFLEVDGLRADRGGRSILRGLSLTLARGELRLLVGASGSGKTTLLRILAGLEPPDAGTVRLGGELASREGEVLVPAARRGIAMTFQDDALWPHMTVERHLTFGLEGDGERGRVDALLEAFGLSARRGERPARFSGGERQRVGLARALAPEAALILLDEPLAHVDLGGQRALGEVLVRILRERGLAALWVTHRPEEALDWVDAVTFLGDGLSERTLAPDEARRKIAGT